MNRPYNPPMPALPSMSAAERERIGDDARAVIVSRTVARLGERSRPTQISIAFDVLLALFPKEDALVQGLGLIRDALSVGPGDGTSMSVLLRVAAVQVEKAADDAAGETPEDAAVEAAVNERRGA